MLNINVNLDVNVSKPTYPVYFDKNICVACGAENTLTFVNIFGKECREEIHPYDHIKCTKCGAKYSIEWMNNKETGKMKPIPSDPSLVKNFMNLVTSKKIKDNGMESI